VAATALSGISSSPRISEIVNVLDLGWFFLGERLVMGLLHWVLRYEHGQWSN
jgi:hypothetical protein